MESIILRTTARFLAPLLILRSFWVYYRGHNNPGGGFIGGLIAAAGYTFYALSHSVDYARAKFYFDPTKVSAFGLLTALSSALLSMFKGQAFMTSLWGHIGPIHVGTPMLFDLGVYFAVVGFSLQVIFILMED